MNNYETLIEFLEKDDLTAEEKNYITRLKDEDPEARKIISVYNNLKSTKRKKVIITEELLADYVLYINGIELKNKNIISLIPEIEKEIRNSENLKKKFAELNSEFSDVDNFITRTFTENKIEARKTYGFYNRFRVYIYSASALAVLYIMLFAAFNIFMPEYKKNIILYDNSDKSYTRGRVSETFQQSLVYINNNDYKTAIDLLNKDIEESHESKTIFYSHYILGLIYLQNSESNFLGLIKTYNRDELLKGIEHLQAAVNSNRENQFKNINLNAYFFIANAYLALDNIEKAKTYLELVRNEKGGYMKNAENILDSFASER